MAQVLAFIMINFAEYAAALAGLDLHEVNERFLAGDEAGNRRVLAGDEAGNVRIIAE
jgi:hypothetical protein